MSEHEMTWSGPFGRSYAVRCSCGWSGFTLADSPETSIKSTFDAHLTLAKPKTGEG